MEEIRLVHLFKEPQEASSSKRPLLLLLHGYGSNEADLYSLSHYIGSKAIVVSLRAPNPMDLGGFCWYDLDFKNDGLGVIHNIAQARDSLNILLEEIPKFQKRYNTDPDQCWLMGFSQGAILSYALALNHPTMFSKVIAMSGYCKKELLNLPLSEEVKTSVSILATHGKFDEIILAESARQSAKMLADLSVNLKFLEYPMQHTISEECLQDILRWMKEQEMI